MQLSDEERRARHARSMSLYDISIAMSTASILLSIVGIAFWQAFIPCAILLTASRFVSARAWHVSPYKGDAE
jgi:hypothetical protein